MSPSPILASREGALRAIEIYKGVFVRFKGQPFRCEYLPDADCFVVWLGDIWVTTISTPRELWNFLKDERLEPGSRLNAIVSRWKATRAADQEVIAAFLRTFKVKRPPERTPNVRPALKINALTIDDLFPNLEEKK